MEVSGSCARKRSTASRTNSLTDRSSCLAIRRNRLSTGSGKRIWIFRMMQVTSEGRSSNPSFTSVCSLGEGAVLSFIVSPHPKDFNGVLGFINLINQSMLNVDPTGMCAGQISDKFLEWRRILKRVFRDDVQETLRLGLQV